jgi:putative isomerase
MNTVFDQTIFSCERDRDLAVRAYQTLMNNVYPREGYLWSPFRCVSPGRGNFRGIWNWDSAFHAAGLARWDTELAKESILGFLQFQREDGLLPDVIRENGTIVTGFGKPPLFAWAAERIFRADGDASFLEAVYAPLSRNAAFWETERFDKGLFFYDADDKESEDYLIRVKYESGWDNSVRWDDGITEYYAVDLNCFMVMFYRSMASIASVLQKETESLTWRSKAEALSVLINQKLWDVENHWYADANRYTGKVSSVLTPASFMPLYIEIASDAQAQSMRDIAVERFDSKMPTVSFDNPSYSNDYWRGPTWLNVAYFAAKGLKHYGFSVAEDIKDSILNMCFADTRGIFENYDSKTGKGLCCNHFSWSAVFILEFILNF